MDVTVLSPHLVGITTDIYLLERKHALQ